MISLYFFTVGKKENNIHKVLKTWTTLEKRKSAGLDVLTPFSLHVAALVPARGEIHAVMGPAPKTWSGSIQIEQDLWLRERKTKIEAKAKNLSTLDKAWKNLLHAQSAHDLGDEHGLHHNLQMAVTRTKDTSFEYATKLFYYYFTFLHEKHPRILSQLLSDVLEIAPKLDKSLIDHAWLLIYRLERILDLRVSIVAAQIHHPRLARLLEVEAAIPNALFDKIIRGLIHPRIDLVDIIYLHERIDP